MLLLCYSLANFFLSLLTLNRQFFFLKFLMFSYYFITYTNWVVTLPIKAFIDNLSGFKVNNSFFTPFLSKAGLVLRLPPPD